jgi:hypothetical protein
MSSGDERIAVVPRQAQTCGEPLNRVRVRSQSGAALEVSYAATT